MSLFEDDTGPIEKATYVVLLGFAIACVMGICCAKGFEYGQRTGRAEARCELSPCPKGSMAMINQHDVCVCSSVASDPVPQPTSPVAGEGSE